ncbi:MAG: SDR family oxidoreductase [Deltaproteobacteria bacterium]|nr:SDR family oxidoreductase [Deltaproteobacteria bacterium]
MSQIAGRHIVVTGGASGIGRLVALKLAGLGGKVTVWDINPEGLDRVVTEINALGKETARGHLCDVSQRAQVYRIATETAAALGPVDILINNAGIVSGRRFLELADEKIEASFAINTLALFWTTKAFLPAMIERNLGHVVTIASAAGLIGVAKLTDYSASKWAAVGFDESLRAELRQVAPGVRTSVICPFYIDTGMFRGVKTRFPALLPILQEDYVATRIVDAIEHDRQRVIMPWLVYVVAPMRALPVRFFDWVARFLGVNATMDDFIGRR